MRKVFRVSSTDLKNISIIEDHGVFDTKAEAKKQIKRLEERGVVAVGRYYKIQKYKTL